MRKVYCALLTLLATIASRIACDSITLGQGLIVWSSLFIIAENVTRGDNV